MPHVLPKPAPDPTVVEVIVHTVPLIADFAVPFVMHVAGNHPRISWRYRAGFGIADLSATPGAVHIALRAGARPPDLPGLRVQALGRLAFGLYATPEYIREHGMLDGTNAARHVLVTHDFHRDHAVFDHWATDNLRGISVGLRTNDETAHRFAIRSGRCAGFLPLSAPIYMPSLTEITPPHPNWRVAFWLVAPPPGGAPVADPAIGQLATLLERSLE